VQDIQSLQGFGEAMTPKGYETSARVVAVQEMHATPDVAEALKLSRGSSVIELTRIRYLNLFLWITVFFQLKSVNAY